MSIVRNGPHDLGGVRGFGAVSRDEDDALYPEGWEGRCIAAIIATIVRGAYNVDQFRARIEELPPAAHFAMGYYRRWLHTLERNLVVQGVFERREIDARMDALVRGDAEVERRSDPQLMEMVEALLRDGGSLVRELEATRAFTVGDRIKTKRIVLARLGEQHTRLPGYLQQRAGVIERCHPPMALPDASVRGEDRADFLYSVSFAAEDLWSDAEHGVRVSADLFESYLEAEA